MEEFITTQKLNAHIDPHLSIWGWEVPVYLFLGGLAAGLLILGAVSVLRGERDRRAAQRLLMAVPVVLAVGMFALFLDLEYKVHVFRFYTAFMVTAPMSWGSWILLAAVPAMLLLIAGTLRSAWPELSERAGSLPFAGRVMDYSEARVRPIAVITVLLAAALGIYTGILLSAYGARPFWNTTILGPLFLVSGLSAAAALAALSSKGEERGRFERLDIILIALEIVLIALMVIGMMSGSLQAQRSAELILGGELTTFFWVFVVGLGLLLPLWLELMHLRGRAIPAFLPAILVIAGGLVFRFFIVEAGQLTSWIAY